MIALISLGNHHEMYFHVKLADHDHRPAKASHFRRGSAVGIILDTQCEFILQNVCPSRGNYSGLRVQGSTRTDAMILDLLRHVGIGPAAIRPR